ncbi:hypothetical protein FGADI_10488 [Fusarium gaditjirri]|uniref:Uncharacterized protein n=1 Tax=Fusarium gaditjirri TaxID=282569 RepID=A0A8H4SX20_9HYPO|nr:hypothetical protein FGADI_10488 [Fusarium gaditjirri]
MDSIQRKLDNIQLGVHALAKDLKSRDIDEFTNDVDQLTKGMKDIASALQGPGAEEANDRHTVFQYESLLVCLNFDAKIEYSKLDRETAFKYPWMIVQRCEEHLKQLELSIQAFADTAAGAGSRMSACTAYFRDIVLKLQVVAMEYLKLRHRRTVMKLDGAVKREVASRDTSMKEEEALSYVSRPFSREFITRYLRQFPTKSAPRGAVALKVVWDNNKGAWNVTEHETDQQAFPPPKVEQSDIQVIMIGLKELANSAFTAREHYDEESVRPPHPLLERFNLDFLDREEGMLHWSLGGVLAWRFSGEDLWMDRFGHVIDEY